MAGKDRDAVYEDCKKPVVIEAVQFDPCGAHRLKLPDGVMGISAPNADNWAYEGCKFFIETLEGRMKVRDKDYIITGVKGEKYPCKPDIFEKTYEPVKGDA
jgi:hypothetical protein